MLYGFVYSDDQTHGRLGSDSSPIRRDWVEVVPLNLSYISTLRSKTTSIFERVVPDGSGGRNRRQEGTAIRWTSSMMSTTCPSKKSTEQCSNFPFHTNKRVSGGRVVEF